MHLTLTILVSSKHFFVPQTQIKYDYLSFVWKDTDKSFMFGAPPD